MVGAPGTRLGCGSRWAIGMSVVGHFVARARVLGPLMIMRAPAVSTDGRGAADIHRPAPHGLSIHKPLLASRIADSRVIVDVTSVPRPQRVRPG